ncbi:MAG TPA: S-layer family protein, partial [Coleofasciculaceae cyanobacterium]
RLLIQDNSEIIVSSGLGNAGNLEITANSIELSDESKLIGETVLGNGGNITLNVRDLLLLRHNSKISATADYARIARDPNFRDVLSTVGVTAPNADGGNITINAGFIVAVPKENSDIIANAFEGRGGRIAIAAQGIFGIEPRPRLTPKSDITASSDLGIDGTVQTNTLGVDPSRGLGELPSNVVDATRLIDRRCTPNSRTQERSRFIITGRGGLPPSPNDTLQNESVISNWVSLNSDVETSVPPQTATPTSSDFQPLVEAQGWYFNEKGEVILTAKAAKVTPQGDWLSLPECNPAQTPSTLQS